jgi:hypothetical protein
VNVKREVPFDMFGFLYFAMMVVCGIAMLTIAVHAAVTNAPPTYEKIGAFVFASLGLFVFYRLMLARISQYDGQRAEW